MVACRFITMVIGLGTLVLSFLTDEIIPLMVLAYELTVSIVFVPVILSILYKKPPKQAAFVSMILGSLSFILFTGLDMTDNRQIFSLLFSLSGFLFSSVLNLTKVG